jgi:uncharacterized protein YggE
MKTNFIKPFAVMFLAGATLQAQSTGNVIQTVSAPAVAIPADATQVNCTGNFAALDAMISPTYSWASGSATNGVIVSGGTGSQSREYYNPYTGKYEASPTVAGGTDKAGAALPYDNTVIFDADVMINVQASSYTAIFSMTDFGTTVFSADSILGARLKTFMTGLKKDSIKDDDIHVDFISMLPVYEVLPENKVFSNIATEKPAGFKIKKNVHVLFYDHRKLDKIITDAAQAGIYDLVKVDYNVANIQSAYDTLRKVAADIIALKRSNYERMGFTTSMVMMAEGYDSKYPEERYASYTAYIQGASAQTIAQQNPHMQIRQAEKEQTVFYNKVPYKQFDKVLNADLAEPGVQFYYKMRVKCKLELIKKDEDKPGVTTKPAAGSYKPPVSSSPQPIRKP